MNVKLKDIFDKKTVVHSFFTFIISLFTTLMICITGYTHYIEKNIINDRVVIQNSNSIKEIIINNKELYKDINILTISNSKINDELHTYDVRLSTIKSSINNIYDYQQTLRKEVREIYEEKLNIISFWRENNNNLIRLRWLEENMVTMGKYRNP